MTNGGIIYVWDPLCGWCYTFSTVLARIRNEFAGAFDFDILSGGLAIGERVGPVSQKAVYIRKRLPDVERISGVKFGEKYLQLLDEGNSVNDSLPPSIAFKVLRSFRDNEAFNFAYLIQHAHFYEGKDLGNIRVYLEICEKYEINKHAFMERFEDPAFRKMAEDDFQLTRNWGVEKYPSLVGKKEHEMELIHKGYATFDELKKILEEKLVK